MGEQKYKKHAGNLQKEQAWVFHGTDGVPLPGLTVPSEVQKGDVQ